MFKEAAALGVLHVHLSGGEPGARRDLVDIAANAREAGLYTNLITSGVGITTRTMRDLWEAGLDHVQVSIQDADAVSADRIAGYRGAFQRKHALAAEAVRLGLPLTVNLVVHRANIERISEMVDLALKLKASRIEIAHVQYYGWALKNRAALMPTAEQVDARSRRGRRAAPQASRQDRHRRRGAGLSRAVSEALRRRLGPALAQRHAVGPRAAVPCGGVDPGARRSGTSATMRWTISGRIRRPSTRSAAPISCRRLAPAASGARSISAAAAARPSC